MKYSMQIVAEDCPNMSNGCTNDGCVPHQVGEHEWEVQKCQFCYEVPWSRFNIDKIKEAYEAYSKLNFDAVKTGRIDSTKPNLSNVPKTKEED